MNQLILETSKPLVLQAYNVASYIYNKYNGKIPDAQIKEKIKDSLSPVRFFNGTQYYFIISTDAEGVMLNNQPTGTNTRLSGYVDPHGNNILNDMVKIATNNQEGFYTYYWSKPGAEGNNHKKSSYIKLFEPYNWIIGTGVYYEDYDKELKNRLLDKISEIRFGSNNNGYIFVVTFDGTTLMNRTQKHLIGKNMWDIEDVNGVKVIQEEREAVRKPDGDFIYYHWNNPATGKISQKASFVKGEQDWEWMIGAGYYYDDVDPVINALHDEIYDDSKQELVEYISIVATICIIIILFRKAFTRRLERDIHTLIDSFNKAANNDKLIETDQIKYQEFDELAQYANKMLSERISAKNKLEKLNNELHETVKNEIKKNERHTQALHEQKKHADMGQMINAIAHQWRQPLNNIHLITQMLKEIDNGADYNIDKETLYQQHADLVEYMSRTIDDFRNYFSVRKQKQPFNVKEEIDKTVALIQAQMSANNISIDVSSDQGADDTFNGLAGEFRQIIMNLLSNAKDAIEDKRKKGNESKLEHIKIRIISSKDEIIVEIYNTGSHIPEDVLSKIFDPYFTTKEEGKGTGIGLYLTKTILKNEMNGTITANNSEDGVTFAVSLSK